MSGRAPRFSLSLRLLAVTLVSLCLALAGAGLWLTSLFRQEVTREFDAGLVRQLDQLTARLQVDGQGVPVIDGRSLSDPRMDLPYSGLYWQLDRMDGNGSQRQGVLRSRSLWDAVLALEADVLADGQLHVHDIVGPRGQSLRAVERALQIEEAPARWRLIVAADRLPSDMAVQRFRRLLGLSLAALGLLLALAALAQLWFGLAPLRAMQQALARVRDGRSSRIEGRFPSEVQPLIDEFHGVLARQEASLERARTQAGNLAHALKTPLSVLSNAALRHADDPLARTVTEQVRSARRHIDWHLTRARVAAVHGLPGHSTPVEAVVAGLQRVMQKVHAQRQLAWSEPLLEPGLCFAGEEQDLQEMLGNLLDNAGRMARQTVRVRARRSGSRQLLIEVDDDGPGIAPQQRDVVLQRGVRLDQSTPGSGLGLSIVAELAELYGGGVQLGTSDLGGLTVGLTLPAAS